MFFILVGNFNEWGVLRIVVIEYDIGEITFTN